MFLKHGTYQTNFDSCNSKYCEIKHVKYAYIKTIVLAGSNSNN